MDKTIKTFERIRTDVLNHYWGRKITMATVDEMAAKEYAKQWVDLVACRAKTQMAPGGVKWIDTTTIRNIKLEIDAHGKG